MGKGRHLGVLLLLLLLVAVQTWPLLGDPAHLLPHHHDPYLFGWVMMTVFDNLLTDPLSLLQGNALYPLGNTITLSEPLIVPGIFAGAVQKTTGDPFVAYNVTLLFFWALSGWCMYLVARRLTGSDGAGAVAAVIFTLAPYRVDYHLEFQMQILFALPPLVYFFVRYLERQKWRDLLLFLLFFWMQALSVWYYALITALALVPVGLFTTAAVWRRIKVRTLGLLAAGGVLLGASLFPLAKPYFATKAELGFTRSLSEVTKHSADILSYLDSPLTRLYTFHSGPVDVETSLFPGVTALGLSFMAAATFLWGKGRKEGALARLLPAAFVLTLVGAAAATILQVQSGLLRGRDFPNPLAVFLCLSALLLLAGSVADGLKGRAPKDGLEDSAWIGLLLLLAILAFTISLGPVVHYDDAELGSGLYGWLYPHFLPLHAMRVATRFGVLVLFSFSLLAAFGFKRILHGRSRTTISATTAALLALLAVEYASFPLPYQHHQGWDDRPQVYRYLEGMKTRATVLELPITAHKPDTEAMFYSLGHKQFLVNGFSGFRPFYQVWLSRLFSSGKVEEALRAVRELYPDPYILVKRPAMAKFNLEGQEEALAEAGVLVAEDGDDALYRLSLPPVKLAGTEEASPVPQGLRRVLRADLLKKEPFFLLEGRLDEGTGQEPLLFFCNGNLIGVRSLDSEWRSIAVPVPGECMFSARQNVLVARGLNAISWTARRSGFSSEGVVRFDMPELQRKLRELGFHDHPLLWKGLREGWLERREENLAAFGRGVRLVAYDMPEAVSPGESFTYRLFWRCPPGLDISRYWTFMHFLGGKILFQSDQPFLRGYVPLAQGYPHIFVEEGSIEVPPGIAETSMQVSVGLSEHATGKKVDVETGLPKRSGGAVLPLRVRVER